MIDGWRHDLKLDETPGESAANVLFRDVMAAICDTAANTKHCDLCAR